MLESSLLAWRLLVDVVVRDSHCACRLSPDRMSCQPCLQEIVACFSARSDSNAGVSFYTSETAWSAVTAAGSSTVMSKCPAVQSTMVTSAGTYSIVSHVSCPCNNCRVRASCCLVLVWSMKLLELEYARCMSHCLCELDVIVCTCSSGSTEGSKARAVWTVSTRTMPPNHLWLLVRGKRCTSSCMESTIVLATFGAG